MMISSVSKLKHRRRSTSIHQLFDTLSSPKSSRRSLSQEPPGQEESVHEHVILSQPVNETNYQPNLAVDKTQVELQQQPSNTSNFSPVENQVKSGLLSPPSSNSSRSSLSSPIQIRINNSFEKLPQVNYPPVISSSRRSLNYEISRIDEKRLEEEKKAISYAEKVLSRRSFQSQRKDKSSPGAMPTPQVFQHHHYHQHSGILKRKLPNIEPDVAQINSSFNKDNNHNNLFADSNSLAPFVSPFNTGNTQNLVNTSSGSSNNVKGKKKELSWQDRKSVQRATKLNTEHNSVIQPEQSLSGVAGRLGRCMMHSKRIMELVCAEDKCKAKNKFGCVLCFSFAGDVCPHSFHEYRQIITDEDLKRECERQRKAEIKKYEDHIKSDVVKKLQIELQSLGKALATAIQGYVQAQPDEYYYNQTEKENKQNQDDKEGGDVEKDKSTSSDVQTQKETHKKEKDVDPCGFLTDIAENLTDKIASLKEIYCESKYLGEKPNDSQFSQEKKRFLLIISRLLARLPRNILEIYQSSPNVEYNCDTLENDSPKLVLIKDDISEGIYQTENAKIKKGRGIQFFRSGTIYEGYFKNNQKHGVGKLVTFNGDLYIGNFKKNLKSGKGMMQFANGDTYNGDFFQDQFHGNGIMTYSIDGTAYSGEWSKNQRHGKGSMIKDGKVLSTGIYVFDNLKPNDSKSKSKA